MSKHDVLNGVNSWDKRYASMSFNPKFPLLTSIRFHMAEIKALFLISAFIQLLTSTYGGYVTSMFNHFSEKISFLRLLSDLEHFLALYGG
jgi:hypothetical protein